jgi:hypothetical protein
VWRLHAGCARGDLLQWSRGKVVVLMVAERWRSLPTLHSRPTMAPGGRDGPLGGGAEDADGGEADNVCSPTDALSRARSRFVMG